MICSTNIFIGYEKYIFACGGYNIASNNSKFDVSNKFSYIWLHARWSTIYKLNSQEMYLIKLQKSLYGLR